MGFHGKRNYKKITILAIMDLHAKRNYMDIIEYVITLHTNTTLIEEFN